MQYETQRPFSPSLTYTPRQKKQAVNKDFSPELYEIWNAAQQKKATVAPTTDPALYANFNDFISVSRFYFNFMSITLSIFFWKANSLVFTEDLYITWSKAQQSRKAAADVAVNPPAAADVTRNLANAEDTSNANPHTVADAAVAVQLSYVDWLVKSDKVDSDASRQAYLEYQADHENNPQVPLVMI